MYSFCYVTCIMLYHFIWLKQLDKIKKTFKFHDRVHGLPRTVLKGSQVAWTSNKPNKCIQTLSVSDVCYFLEVLGLHIFCNRNISSFSPTDAPAGPMRSLSQYLVFFRRKMSKIPLGHGWFGHYFNGRDCSYVPWIWTRVFRFMIYWKNGMQTLSWNSVDFILTSNKKQQRDLPDLKKKHNPKAHALETRLAVPSVQDATWLWNNMNQNMI